MSFTLRTGFGSFKQKETRQTNYSLFIVKEAVPTPVSAYTGAFEPNPYYGSSGSIGERKNW